MVPSCRWHGSGRQSSGFLGLLAAAAALCANIPCSAAASLRSAGGQPGAFDPGAEAPFGCCDASVKRVEREKVASEKDTKLEKRFLVEWVDLTASGDVGHSVYHYELEAKHGRLSPQRMAGSRCLTAGKKDALGGSSLSWSLCRGGVQGDKIGRKKKDGSITDAGAAVLAAAHRASQEFILDESGRLRTQGGLCVRRMKADGPCSNGHGGVVYDLGNCNGDVEPATFIAGKAQRGDPNQLETMGYIVDAVKEDSCSFCGPYIIQERCMSGGGPSVAAPGCPQDFSAKPGWTRQPATYVGDAAVAGKAGISKTQEITDMFTFNSASSDAVTMSGLGSTDHLGSCGSFVTDGPYVDSAFYLHQVIRDV